MQNIFILQLQGTGNDENAWENAGVFTTQDSLSKHLREINADYLDCDEEFFRLFDNARMEIWKIN